MATNAERQAAWRARQKQKLALAQAEQQQQKPYYANPDSPEQYAVNLLHNALRAIQEIEVRTHTLASHIGKMANGTIDYPNTPLWRCLKYRDCLEHHDSFEQYLLSKKRGGLGVPSLAWLYEQVKGYPRAIETLRREIPDFDKRINPTSDKELDRLREALRNSTKALAEVEDERDKLKVELSRLRQQIEPTETPQKGQKKRGKTGQGPGNTRSQS